MSTVEEWETLRRRLLTLAACVAEEIKTYPPPITACDAQFNHLLELRRLLPQELERLRIFAADKSQTIENFIRTSPYGQSLDAPSVRMPQEGGG
jgi:hypothetical protein